MKFEIHSLQETKNFAQAMAARIQGHDLVVCLSGDLGAGKTTWTQTFGKRLALKKSSTRPRLIL